jgi:hypothetical protein
LDWGVILAIYVSNRRINGDYYDAAGSTQNIGSAFMEGGGFYAARSSENVSFLVRSLAKGMNTEEGKEW